MTCLPGLRVHPAFICFLVVLSGLLSGFDSVRGQQASNPPSETVRPFETAESDSGEVVDPNTVPFRTRTSVLTTALGLPARLWRLAWWPPAKAIIWIDQNKVHERVINWFVNDTRTAGMLPIMSVGGNTGFGAGVLYFHNDLWSTGRKVRASFLFSGEDNTRLSLTYSDSSLFNSGAYVIAEANWFTDSDENLFVRSALTDQALQRLDLNANATTEDDETSYSTKQFDVSLESGYTVNRHFGVGLIAGYKRARIGVGDGEGGEDFPVAIPGAGSSHLLSIGASLTFDYRNGWPRTLSGTLLRLATQYNTDIDHFVYSRYTAEIQQFVPAPFLARNRRLAFRARFEKLNRHGGKQIPFYELSVLGTSRTLRGYDQNRFRGRGLLLLNAEYRYPIWDTWDAVIFLDEGQVFDDYTDIRLDRFHFAVGAGIRVMSRRGFIFRLEAGASREMVRWLFRIVPNY